MDSGYKVFAEVRRNRLGNYLEQNNKLSDKHMGPRRGGGTADAIYVLKSVGSGEIIKGNGKV